ncbi:hypothetical protein [Thermoanaerobacter kivui]|uniref:hypothetical protein n=1 Tax=Thermoanaerobacter kivui TaxID=2325 RepID=UPI001F3B4FC4|nr:hypothetical protein [Thermoanaerobacter kivui]
MADFERPTRGEVEVFGINVSSLKETASSSSKIASKRLDENGKYIWPPNNGFEGTPVKRIFKPGERFDRYGDETGEFTAPRGTPFEFFISFICYL